MNLSHSVSRSIDNILYILISAQCSALHMKAFVIAMLEPPKCTKKQKYLRGEGNVCSLTRRYWKRVN